MTSKHKWFLQLNNCAKKGYAAGLKRQGRRKNPYLEHTGQGNSGVQPQRAAAWERGRKRAIDGKPLEDHNG